MGLFNFSRLPSTDAAAYQRLFANLDLSVTPPAQHGALTALPEFVDTLHGRIARSLEAAVGIAAHAPQLASIAGETERNGEQLSQSSEMIASAIEEISTTLESELVPGASAVALLTGEVTQQLKQCEADSRLVLCQVETIQTAEGSLAGEIQRLGKQIEEVTQVIGMIATISQQTNLLALNAAIEAARAGEQGRGFAVVADEVRSLAQRTRQSTVSIHEVIENFRAQVDEVVAATRQGEEIGNQGLAKVRETEAALKDIVQNIEGISDSFMTMSAAFEEQSQVSDEINQQVVRIAGLADSSTEKAEGAKSASEGVSRQAHGLNDLVARFTSHQ